MNPQREETQKLAYRPSLLARTRMFFRPSSVAQVLQASSSGTPGPMKRDGAPPLEAKITRWRHILRTVIVAGIFLSFVFVMTLVQMWLDNRSLKYLYGVETRADWEIFNESVKELTKIDSNKYIKNFPAVLLKEKFGGKGKAAGEFIKATNSTTPFYSLLLHDIVFYNTVNDYGHLKVASDICISLFFLATAIYLILMPYFEAFKTKIRKTFTSGQKSSESFKSMKTNAVHIEDTTTSLSSAASKLDANALELGKTLAEDATPTTNAATSTDLDPVKQNKKVLCSTSFFFPSRYIHSLVFFRRLIIVVGFTYFFRACVLSLTVLTPENLFCIPHYRDEFFEIVFGAFSMFFGIEATCHDYLYSGHTALATVCFWFWGVYASHVLFHPKSPVIDLFMNQTSICSNDGEAMSKSSVLNQSRRKPFQMHWMILWLIRLIGLCVLVIIILSIILSRMHYTIDVILGLFIASLSFWIWHSFLTIYYYIKFKSHILQIEAYRPSYTEGLSFEQLALKEDNIIIENREVRDILVPLKKFNFILSFVGWVDGYDLYIHDNIGYCGPDSITTTSLDASFETAEMNESLLYPPV